MKKHVEKVVALLLLIVMSFTSLVGCTLEAAASGKVSKSEIQSRVARLIDEELENVLPLLEENDDLEFTDSTGRSIDIRSLKGSDIVARAIEDGGEEYINFSYKVLTATTTDEIVKSAKGLVSDEDYQMLVEKAKEEEEHAARIFEEQSRQMTMAQQKELYKDLKKLVIKAVVLLTAGLVYHTIT